MIEKLEAMLAGGQDSASLRFALANHYLREDETERAIEHAQVAVELDADYSAAWRLLGQALTAAEQLARAREAFERGIEVADRMGDRQVAKEMQVFLRRLDQSADDEASTE